jgi:hypothetical protein
MNVMLVHAEPSDWSWLVVSVLAVWRLTSLLCFDSGPFDVMSKVRLALYRLKLGNLLECFHCTALWISVFVAVAVYELRIATVFLAIAAAGGASIIERSLSHESILEEKNDGS